VNIVLSAEDAAGIQLLRALRQRAHRIVAVMTSAARSSRAMATVGAAAMGMGLPVWPAELLTASELATTFMQEGVDILLNVHSLVIVKAEVLAVLPLGAWNLHPSLLPRYAGLNSPSWALYHGETEHGVTVHRMNQAIDAGPIAYQTRFPVATHETGLSLSTRCIRAGVDLMLQLVDTASNDPTSIPATPQDPSRRRYFGRQVPQGGRIRWDRPAGEIWNLVRACDYRPFPSPWGVPETIADGRAVGILSVTSSGDVAVARPGTVRVVGGDTVQVACSDYWLTMHGVRVDGTVAAPVQVLSPGQVLGDEPPSTPPSL
jgi:UDP-4-amino-4-deoxy-L-arabinose formyltransferase/UDP-glucuronic acid dehydrogenase (UDP-4-keto-hexauronic acid decarboxylating)